MTKREAGWGGVGSGGEQIMKRLSWSGSCGGGADGIKVGMAGDYLGGLGWAGPGGGAKDAKRRQLHRQVGRWDAGGKKCDG